MNKEIIIKYIRDRMKKEVEYEYDLLKKELYKNLDERLEAKKQEILVGILLEVMELPQIESYLTRFVFEIK